MRVVALILGICFTSGLCAAQLAKPDAVDSDRDGLSDALEGALLQQFQPRLMISKTDCSVRPARFAPDLLTPTVLADDGTLYAQAFPRGNSGREIELHYYHLWRRDCGEMGHALDTEHVSVLLRRKSGANTRADAQDASTWSAIYWYAAAHEDTVCDASQITRASTLGAESSGPAVWISAGKHGSFFKEELCRRGCGGDRCLDSEALTTPAIVNLGELSYAMGDALWVRSPTWPLALKMGRSDFTSARLARLDRLPDSDIAWANPAKRPTQAAILGGNSAVNGVALGGRSTDTALVVADANTNGALRDAAQNTGRGLQQSYRNVRKALGSAVSKTGKALGAENAQSDPR